VDANNGRVSAVALYADIPGLGALTAAWDGFPALNSIDAQQLIASLGNPGSLPTGCIDQIESKQQPNDFDTRMDWRSQ